jgi:hypothetical protein
MCVLQKLWVPFMALNEVAVLRHNFENVDVFLMVAQVNAFETYLLKA